MHRTNSEHTPATFQPPAVYSTPTRPFVIRSALPASLQRVDHADPSFHISSSPPPSAITFHASRTPLAPRYSQPTPHRRTRAEIFFFFSDFFFLFLKIIIRGSRIHDSAYLTTSRTLNSSLITIPAPPQLHPHPETTPKPPRSVGDVGTDSDNGYHARR